MKKSVLLAAGLAFAAGSAFAGDTIWSVEYNGGLNTVGTFDSGNPAVITNIGNMGITAFVNNLEFDGSGNLWTSDGFSLYSVNKGTGAATVVGGHGSVGSSGMTDMSWDGSTMYGISTSCAVSSQLHTINLGTGAATTVCSALLPGACDVGLTFDGQGNLFGHDLVSDTIYSITLGSCTTSTLVSLPFDSNFGQGLTANSGTGQCYHVAFNNSAFQAELYEFDAGGSYNLVGAFSVLQIAGADVEEGAGSCLQMTVSTLIAGTSGNWNVSGGTPGGRFSIPYGNRPGTSRVNGTLGYCATFDFAGLNASKTVCKNKSFDGSGNGSCRVPIPANARGVRVLSQAAEAGTCPNECVSNLDDQVVG